MNIHDLFYKVMSEYGEVLAGVKANNDFKNPFRNLIGRDIPQALSELVNITEPYEVVGSYGKGRWTDVPWIAVFDNRITKSAQKGVYIVYLINKDSKELYLTLEVSATEAMTREINLDDANPFLSIAGVHNSKLMDLLRQKACLIRENLPHFNFSTDNNISSGSPSYDNGAILYKRYTLTDLPSDNVLISDLLQMLEAYRCYYQYTQGMTNTSALQQPHAIGNFDSWEIIDENTAIKTCDKSFFEHRGSGVPRGICWFWDADNMQPGENASVTLRFQGETYSGRVSNESSDRHRVRIFWNSDLANRFNQYRHTDGARAVFHRLTPGEYEVSFQEGENEMPLTNKEKLNLIKEYIDFSGFSYEDGLIENFYLSLKSKPFVILAGTSGTGKTKLVRLFSEAIGAEYKLVPVRPDWSDSSDLFGHVDLNGKFVPGPVIDFLDSARKHPEKPYLLCLDEMNLARVEYYLSDFLSIIETRRWENGKIVSAPLIDWNQYGPDEDARKKYGRLEYPSNLYVVGTVNMDETTFPFSKKVLDRANTIEFSHVNLIPDFGVMGEPPMHLAVNNSFLQTDYLLLKDCAESAEYITGVCGDLENINRILQKANAHVGYRVRDEIIFYMLNNCREERILPEADALDNEIMQKILPRIQGSSSDVYDMLCDLFKICGGDYTQKTGDSASDKMRKVLEDTQMKCKYRKSAEKLKLMAQRFEQDGFTSYWL